MKKILKVILNTIPYLILLISFILIINVGVSVSKGESPTLFGKAIYYIQTGSMEDTIMTGDIIFVDTTVEEYHVGDIITFKADVNNDNELDFFPYTHRIVKIDSTDGVKLYTTKGDNDSTNPISNDWEIDFTQDRIIGKYTNKSGFLGSIYTMVSQGGVSLIFIVIIIVFVAIGAMEVVNIVNAVNKQKKEKAKEDMIQEELERLRKDKSEEEE